MGFKEIIEEMNKDALKAVPNEDHCGVELTPGEVVRVTNALLAVLSLHAPVEAHYGTGQDCEKCSTQYEEGASYPCQTVRVIQEQFDKSAAEIQNLASREITLQNQRTEEQEIQHQKYWEARVARESQDNYGINYDI